MAAPVVRAALVRAQFEYPATFEEDSEDSKDEERMPPQVQPQDERGLQILFRDLKNPKLDLRYKASIEIRNAVNLAHRGKQSSKSSVNSP